MRLERADRAARRATEPVTEPHEPERLVERVDGEAEKPTLATSERFTVDTDAPDDQIARAIALSHDKYCSVWHSMRQDIAFTTSFNR